MSRSVEPHGKEGTLTDPPQFELDYLVDDVEKPSKVMIVPDWDNDRGLSEWLTIDIDHAEALEDIR